VSERCNFFLREIGWWAKYEHLLFANLLAPIFSANLNATTGKNLRWQDRERYLNRQHPRMKLGGFLGEVTQRVT